MVKTVGIAWGTVGALVVGSIAGCAVRDNTGSSNPVRPTPERDRQILIDLAHRQSEGLQLVSPCISKAQLPELPGFLPAVRQRPPKVRTGAPGLVDLVVSTIEIEFAE